MVLVADDLAGWLIGVVADAGRKKLTSVVLGSEQERALRPAATAALQRTAEELRPGNEEEAGQLALVVNEVFKASVAAVPLAGDATVLEALRAGITGQLAVLDDASLTGTGQSSADVLGVPGGVVAQKLTAHLLREIITRGARGGPLAPLAGQLNHDVTHLQGRQIEAGLVRLTGEVQALARLGSIHAVAAAPVALAQLPAATAGFTGRDDELALLAGLLDPAGTSGPVVVSAVAGLAGVGKTTLAIQAGHAAADRGWFGGGVLFIDLHGYDEAPVEPGQALDALLRALGVSANRIPPTDYERTGLYRSVLAQISKPVLVIADNASTEAQVRPLLPGAGPHKVLVTSRHTLAGLNARLVDVTVLDDAAAVELLDAALHAARPDDDRITGDRPAAARLAGLCAGLPLALQIAAALLKADPVLSATELAGQLSDEKDRLAVLRYGDGSGPAMPSIAAAFELSYHRLNETDAHVFRLLPVNPGPDISTSAAAALADLPTGEVRKVLASLAVAHLIEATRGVTARWRMHDLLRLYAQQLSDTHAEGDQREQARDRLLGHYIGRAHAANDHLRALPGIQISTEFTGQDAALAWLDAERASLIATVAMAADAGRDQAVVRLPFALAGYLEWRRRFDDWIAITTISLDTARRLGDRRTEATALNYLGFALRNVRRFDEAISACQEAAAIDRQTGDRQSEGIALDNLGVALRQVRRFEGAVIAHQDAAAIFRQTGDRYREGIALANLGLALRHVRRLDEAADACQEAAAIFRQTGGRYREATALDNLGLALRHLRRFNEAITVHQDAAAIFRETGDRYREATALDNLGLALRYVRRFNESVEAHQKGLSIFRVTEDQHRAATAQDNLGVALRSVGQFEEAVTAHQDAVAIFRQTGDRHREAGALTNLGDALQEVGRYGEAITACQKAKAVYRETEDKHGEGMALNSLGNALREVGRFKDAITEYQDAVAIFRDTGDQHNKRLAMSNLEAAKGAHLG
jgi:tetratricopeptide (TPR) repeat protein